MPLPYAPAACPPPALKHIAALHLPRAVAMSKLTGGRASAPLPAGRRWRPFKRDRRTDARLPVGRPHAVHPGLNPCRQPASAGRSLPAPASNGDRRAGTKSTGGRASCHSPRPTPLPATRRCWPDFSRGFRPHATSPLSLARPLHHGAGPAGAQPAGLQQGLDHDAPASFGPPAWILLSAGLYVTGLESSIMPDPTTPS